MRSLKRFFRRYEIALAFLVVLGGLAIILFGSPSPSTTCLNGDMRWRYAAQVPPAIAEVYLDAERINVGLGAAAIGGWDGLGDALAVGGRVFVRHTNRRSPKYYELTSNRYFQSNAFVYVPAARLAEAYYNVGAATSLDRLLTSLLHEYPGGIIAAGALRFASMRTIAMAAPAISGKAVMFNTTGYYTRPMENLKNAWGYVVLITAPNDARLASILPPLAARTAPSGHALVLQLPDAPDAGATSSLENTVAVGQLLKDSTATEGQLAIYPIERIVECDDAKTSLNALPR